MERERQSQISRINTTERQGGRKEEQPKVGPKGAAPKGRRKSNGEAEKSRGLFAARMERLFCKSPCKQACRCLYKNPAIPASRACPVFFLEANSWQFLHLATSLTRFASGPAFRGAVAGSGLKESRDEGRASSVEGEVSPNSELPTKAVQIIY